MSTSSLTRESSQHSLEPCHDLRHVLVIERLRGVRRLVIVWVSEERGVGDHHGWIALLPEGPVVGHAGAVDALRCGDPASGKANGATERTLAAASEPE